MRQLLARDQPSYAVISSHAVEAASAVQLRECADSGRRDRSVGRSLHGQASDRRQPLRRAGERACQCNVHDSACGQAGTASSGRKRAARNSGTGQSADRTSARRAARCARSRRGRGSGLYRQAGRAFRTATVRSSICDGSSFRISRSLVDTTPARREWGLSTADAALPAPSMQRHGRCHNSPITGVDATPPQRADRVSACVVRRCGEAATRTSAPAPRAGRHSRRLHNSPPMFLHRSRRPSRAQVQQQPVFVAPRQSAPLARPWPFRSRQAPAASAQCAVRDTGTPKHAGASAHHSDDRNDPSRRIARISVSDE
jgi:hypothetical protein